MVLPLVPSLLKKFKGGVQPNKHFKNIVTFMLRKVDVSKAV